jgi:hypothetical protein
MPRADLVSAIASQSSGTTMFTSPTDYVPATDASFVTPNRLTGFAMRDASVRVTSAGAVIIQASGGNGSRVSLDGIVFPLD